MPFRIAAGVRRATRRVTRGVFRDPSRVRVRVRVNLRLERERGEDIVFRLDVLRGHRRGERQRKARLLGGREGPAELGGVQARARGAKAARRRRGLAEGAVEGAEGAVHLNRESVAADRVPRGGRRREAGLKRRHRRASERAKTGRIAGRSLRGNERGAVTNLRVQPEHLQAVPRGDHHGDVLVIRGGRIRARGRRGSRRAVERAEPEPEPGPGP